MIQQPQRDWNQKILDDLEVGEDKVRIECGDLLSVGFYKGLIRNGEGRWFVRLARQRGKGFYGRDIPTDEITAIKRIRRTGQ